MARTYGEKFLRELAASEDGGLGTKLGKACVAANIPATEVAKLLEVSRITVYGWFRGRNIKAEVHRKAIADLLRLIEYATERGLLPAASRDDVDKFCVEVMGGRI